MVAPWSVVWHPDCSYDELVCWIWWSSVGSYAVQLYSLCLVYTILQASLESVSLSAYSPVHVSFYFLTTYKYIQHRKCARRMILSSYIHHFRDIAVHVANLGSYVIDVSLLAPVFTLLADSPSEIGARIGVGFFFQGLGGLVGTSATSFSLLFHFAQQPECLLIIHAYLIMKFTASPIIGALLTEKNEWWRAIIYSGVSSLQLILVQRLNFASDVW